MVDSRHCIVGNRRLRLIGQRRQTRQVGHESVVLLAQEVAVIGDFHRHHVGLLDEIGSLEQNHPDGFERIAEIGHVGVEEILTVDDGWDVYLGDYGLCLQSLILTGVHEGHGCPVER